ncbi:MAG TPA: hypothetical protein VES42_16155 [Pilimelia sp.]|nr:hypothetical protein [Pilimelia sp.]
MLAPPGGVAGDFTGGTVTWLLEGCGAMTVLMERPDYLRVGHGEVPPARTFSLIVDSVPGPAQVRALAPLGELAWEPSAALARVRFEWPAPTLAEAVAAAVRQVEAVGLRALRVDAGDWLTLRDVAARVGRSRETVRLWSVGRLGPGGFPPPLNPGSDTSFYSWVEVCRWARTRLGLPLPAEEPAVAAANLAVQLRGLAPHVVGMAALHRLVRP